ncbi:MAG: hypothetical protein J6C85_00675 [Alphaproteobacteria bacterium]|nr:hypothetical protein [Alphaproteobacteria bacterium]
MRMYPLAVFFMGGEFIYAMLAVYKPQKGDFLKFALFSLLALYTHYYCVILSIVIWGIVFIDLLRLKKYHDLISFFIGGFCVALLFVPWFFAFLSQYQNITDLWYPQVGHAFMAIDGALFSYHYVSREYYKILCFFGILCWLFVFEFLFDVKKEKLEYIVIKRATIVFWSIYLIALALSLFLRPNLVERYLVIPVAIFYMGIAVSFVHFKKFRLIFLSLFVIVFIMGYNGNRLKVQDKNYQQMQTYLRENLPQNSLILYDHTTSHLALMFYAPEKNICKALRKKYLELFKEKVKQEEKNLENLKKYDKIYYMLSLWDWTEYNNCQEQWRSKYDNTAYCLKEISADTAKSIILHSKN